MSSSLPLAGLNVLEFAGLAPGPLAGMVLADFGASVVRVDKPSSVSNPPPDPLCRGKRSIAIDPKVPSGNAVLRKLIERADVLIDPFRPGVMERLGLGPEVFLGDRGCNKRLVYARLVGFSRTGPHKDMVGHDLNYLALSGVLSMFPGEEKPSFPINILGDFAGGGLTCALGILLALLERQKSGFGQVVNTDMVSGIRYISTFPILYSFYQPGPYFSGPRGTNLADGGGPYYNIYTCADSRWMSIACLEPQFFQTFLDLFCGALPKGFALADGWRPTLAAHSDTRLWPRLKEYMENGFRLHPRDYWARVFHGTDACAVPVLSVTEAAALAHGTSEAAAMPLPVPHPGLSRTPSAAVQGMTPADVRRHLRLQPGHHTQEILDELWTSEMEKQVEEEKLRSDGAFGAARAKL